MIVLSQEVKLQKKTDLLKGRMKKYKLGNVKTTLDLYNHLVDNQVIKTEIAYWYLLNSELENLKPKLSSSPTMNQKDILYSIEIGVKAVISELNDMKQGIVPYPDSICKQVVRDLAIEVIQPWFDHYNSKKQIKGDPKGKERLENIIEKFSEAVKENTNSPMSKGTTRTFSLPNGDIILYFISQSTGEYLGITLMKSRQVVYNHLPTDFKVIKGGSVYKTSLKELKSEFIKLAGKTRNNSYFLAVSEFLYNNL